MNVASKCIQLAIIIGAIHTQLQFMSKIAITEHLHDIFGKFEFWIRRWCCLVTTGGREGGREVKGHQAWTTTRSLVAGCCYAHGRSPNRWGTLLSLRTALPRLRLQQVVAVSALADWLTGGGATNSSSSPLSFSILAGFIHPTLRKWANENWFVVFIFSYFFPISPCCSEFKGAIFN